MSKGAHCVAACAILLQVGVFSAGTAGLRNFVGTPPKLFTLDPFVPEDFPSGARLVFYDNFNDWVLSSKWKVFGALNFEEFNRVVSVKIGNKKRCFKSGTILLDTAVSLQQPLILQTEYSFPNSNPMLSISIFFAFSREFDTLGHPRKFLRYYKRSKFEILEKNLQERDRLVLWGQNMAVESGKLKQVRLELCANNVRLVLDGHTAYEGPHFLSDIPQVTPGLWASTRGDIFINGKICFDNFNFVTVPPVSSIPAEMSTAPQTPGESPAPPVSPPAK